MSSKYPAYGSAEFNRLCTDLKKQKYGIEAVVEEKIPETKKFTPVVAKPVVSTKPKKEEVRPPVKQDGTVPLSWIIENKPPKKVVIQYMKDYVDKIIASEIGSDSDAE